MNNEWNSMWKAAMVPYLKVLYWYSIGDTEENLKKKKKPDRPAGLWVRTVTFPYHTKR